MKKLFWMTRSQRFSIRKYSIGVASVLIGMFLLGTPKGASADELTNTNDVTTTEVVGSVTNDSSSTTTSTTTEAVSTAQETPTVNQEVAQATKGIGSSLNSSAVSEDSHVNAEATRTDSSKITSNVVTEEHTTKEITPAAPSVEHSSQEVKTENTDDKVSKVVEAPTTPADNKNTDKATTKVDDEVSLDDDLAAVEDFLNKNQDSKLSDGANTRSGRVIGDDYPAAWRNNPNTVDSWGYYTGNCTSFVANRLHNVNHFEVPRAMGNGAQWGAVARSLGYRVDNTPAVGSVAYYTDGVYGHVAWVAEIVGGNIVVEEYNWIRNGKMDYTYHPQTQSISKPTGTISITNKNDQTGTFDVIISNVSSPNGVKEVKVPTWSSENGQDDIIWYVASKQGDGTYKVSVNPSDHKNSLGEYNIHLYYVQNDGKMVGVGGTTTIVKAVVRPSIPDKGRYTFSGHASIKAEPKMSSPELAYYDAGDGVNYDKVLLSDGHYWISYIAASGNRRYISVA